MSATLDMDAIIAAATAAAIAAVQGTDATPAKKSRAKATPAKKETPAVESVPTLLRWRGNVAAKPGADFPHTVKRTGESATYHRCTLDEATAMLEAAYASGAFYAYRVK